jgi:uncharacterized protein YegL
MTVGPENTRVAIVKFASGVRTLQSFTDIQSKDVILRKLNDMGLTMGTTAIHSGLIQVILSLIGAFSKIS